MKLRAYETEDWPAVCEIYDLGKPDELRGVVETTSLLPLSSDPDMKSLFNASQIVVAEDSGRVVGFGGNRGSFITWLFVHPEFRRRGVASALVRHMVARLESPVTLNVASENVAACALYQRLGFKVERELMSHFQRKPCSIYKLRYETAA